ncbi:MAG: LacI family DNA-binding transcriptional regulator [Fervidobacterium sp.]|jgi:LacI family transcriptional regulator
MERTKSFVTIKDIARAAGVSIITVSRALSNKGYVAQKTKENIIRIAQELGYTRNCAASSLRTKHSGIIGVIVADNSNPFYAELVKGIEIEARKNGYSIILINTDRNYENEVRAIKTLLQRRVDGLIITAIQSQTEDIRELVENHIPNVIVGSKLDGITTNYVYSDDENGGYIAMKYLLETGHKNILFLNGMEYKFAAKMREKGAKKALKEHNKDAKIRVIRSYEGFDNAYEIFEKYISKTKNFDAVICYNDIYALAVLKVLKEKSIKVPEDVSLLGFDDIQFASIVTPSLTTVRVDKLKLGAEAFNSLIKTIKEKIVTELVVPVELIKRESVAVRF